MPDYGGIPLRGEKDPKNGGKVEQAEGEKILEVLCAVRDRLEKLERQVKIITVEMRHTNAAVAEWGSRCLERCKALDALLGE